MKRLIMAFAIVCAGTAMAQVNVSRESFGSGTPGTKGYEEATKWENNIYHAPQYLPGYPTSATIWPRVVEVECVKTTVSTNCKGYNWLPEYGRGEYLMIRPKNIKQ